MIKHAPVITIDGPSGSGKGTISMRLAKQLGWHYLDSGALYRVVALAAIQQKVSPDAIDELLAVIEQLEVTFAMDATGLEKNVILAGQDVTQLIRSEQTGQMSSQISAIPAVRAALVTRQQTFRQLPGLVTDGRDMGTVIFPDAELKIYLTASAAVRAKRRYLQLKDKGFDGTLAAIQHELEVRDKRDSERSVAPLKPANDAIQIDSSDKAVEVVLADIMTHVNQLQLS